MQGSSSTQGSEIWPSWYILWLKCVGWQFFSVLESPVANRYLHCDPITSGLVSTKDQLLPLFVIDILGHLPGSLRYIRFLFLEKNLCDFSKLLLSRFSRLLCCWSVLRGTFHCVGRLIVFAHCQLIRKKWAVTFFVYSGSLEGGTSVWHQSKYFRSKLFDSCCSWGPHQALL